jgi:hypothetical protein
MAATGDPPKTRLGEVVSAPPGMTMPPQTGYTPFWEKMRGPLYVPNVGVPNVNLSVGSFVQFYLEVLVLPNGATINVAYDISNY